MDSPAQYVEHLQTEIRRLRALDQERAALKHELALADHLRDGVVAASADTAENMSIACERLALLEPVLVAARRAAETGQTYNLKLAVDAFDKAMHKRPRS